MNATIAVSPRISVLLSQVTEAPSVETAMWQVLTEYLDLKTHVLRERICQYEAQWGMPFVAFSERLKADPADRDNFSYEMESAFWDWEEAETLLRHYEGLRAQWT